MKIKNVVFDIGGVILTFLPYKIIEEYSIDKNEETLLVNLYHSQLWKDFDAGTKTLEEISDLYYIETSLSQDRTLGLFNKILNGLFLIEETVLFIEKLKKLGINVYYLSNMSELFMSELKNKYEILNNMSGVYSAEVNCVKPDLSIYRSFDDRFNLNKKETLFLDDMEKNVEAAQSFGWHSFLYNQHISKEVIKKIEELI